MRHNPPHKAPCVILIQPQLGENIGMVARAMGNFGLEELRLVTPKQSPLSERALATARAARRILENAKTYSSATEAVRDIAFLFATTARLRDMAKPVMCPAQACERARQHHFVGFMFGPERVGLSNEDVVLADAIVTFPVDSRCPSLNLAQAVLLVGYEWARSAKIKKILAPPFELQANKGALLEFFEQLENALDNAGFLNPPEKKPSTVRKIRNIFQKASLSERELRILRGIVTALGRKIS